MAKRKKTPLKKTDGSKASSVSTDPTVHRPFRQLRSRATSSATSSAASARPEARTPRESPALEASERSTFAEHMRGVKRLDGASDEMAAPEPDPDAEAREELVRLVVDGIRFDVLDDGAALEGRRLDVDPREIGRLRRRAYPVDDTLDLHGQSVDQARTAVAKFIRTRRVQGDRAVLVVHGRGRHSPGGHAILRGELGAWLSQGSAARDVAAFASVPDGDAQSGGPSGAVLVLLARL